MGRALDRRRAFKPRFDVDDFGRLYLLGWPLSAAARDRHVYVGDCLNHNFAAEATVAEPQ